VARRTQWKADTLPNKRKQYLPDPPSEKQEELWSDKTARMLGFEVIRFSQPRRTMQTRGISDRLYVHPVHRVAVWAEVKSEKGKLSERQQWFLGLVAGVQIKHCGSTPG
jgi:hypothetical protein